MYKKSIEDPEPFWSEQGNRFLVWDEPFAKADNCSKEKGTISWFAGGKLNVSSKFFFFQLHDSNITTCVSIELIKKYSLFITPAYSVKYSFCRKLS